MSNLRKSIIAGSVALGFALCGPVAAQSTDQLADREEQIETLLAELAQPELPTWQSVEERITRLWSQSGSDTADFLLQRGETAMEKEDYFTAIEHFSAATDHAPGFAEGFHARATAFFLIEEHGLALLDIERTLALNPNHFGALSGAGIIYEEMGEPELALKALQLALELNPHRENIIDAIKRLEFKVGQSTL